MQEQGNVCLIHRESNNQACPYSSAKVQPLRPRVRKERSQVYTLSHKQTAHSRTGSSCHHTSRICKVRLGIQKQDLIATPVSIRWVCKFQGCRTWSEKNRTSSLLCTHMDFYPSHPLRNYCPPMIKETSSDFVF